MEQMVCRRATIATAAIVALLHTICSMLFTNSYAHVFAIDFSKAFDSIRHHKLLDKMSSLHIPDQVFNWMAAVVEPVGRKAYWSEKLTSGGGLSSAW